MNFLLSSCLSRQSSSLATMFYSTVNPETHPGPHRLSPPESLASIVSLRPLVTSESTFPCSPVFPSSSLMSEALYVAVVPLNRQIALIGDLSPDQARPGGLPSSIHLLHPFMEWLKHATEESIFSALCKVPTGFVCPYYLCMWWLGAHSELSR